MAKRTTKKTTKRTAKRTAKRTTKKTTARTAKKKTTARRTTAAAAPAKKPTRIVGAKDKARTKSEVFGLISEHVGITKKEVAGVFETLHTMMAADLKKGNVGVVNVGGLMKVTVQRKPATKARKGINPFTGEPTTFKAKPARNVVKIRPLKSLKDAV